MTTSPEHNRLSRVLKARGAVPEMPAERDLALRRQIHASFAAGAEAGAAATSAATSAMGDAHSERIRRGPTRPFGFRWVSAAAAVVLVSLASWRWIEPARPAFDLDGNGRVDIVDAFSLELRAGTVRDRQFDLDGNGVVNAADARVLGSRVVQLSEVVG